MSSPSPQHEIPIDLIRRNPELVELLIRFVLDYRLPDHTYVTVRDSNLSQMISLEYFADLVLSLEDADHKPVGSLVFENQLRKNADKKVSWPGYVVNERKRSGCPTSLVVLVPDDKVEQWALQPIETGHPGFVLKPLVVNLSRVPRVTQANIELGERVPELAVLSSLAHGNSVGGAEIVVTMLGLWSRREQDANLAAVYGDYVLSTLTVAARNAVEAMMNLEGFEFKSDFARKYYGRGEAKGKAEGEAKGEAKSILKVLALRGMSVPEAARERIMSTTDPALLEQWFDRVLRVQRVEELFELA